jgi:hypothetical protein
MSFSLSSFVMFRRRSFSAIITDRSAASRRICWRARSVSSWICRSAFFRMPAASARACSRSSVRRRSASERLRETIASASTRASESSRA